MKKLIKKLFSPVWKAYASRIKNIASETANDANLRFSQISGNLDRKINENANILTGLEERLTELNNQSNEIRQKYNEIHLKNNDLTENIEKLIYKSDQINSCVMSFQKKSDSLNEKIESLDKKSAEVSANMIELADAVQNLTQKVDAANSKLDYLFDIKQPYHSVERIIAASILHPISFAGYKNKYEGCDIVVCGAGPTLNFYTPHKNAVFIGVNRVFLTEGIKFDYIFSQDFTGLKHIQEEFIDYKGNSCVKFLAYQNDLFSEFPESFVDKCKAIRYYTDMGIRSHGDWVRDITTSRFALDIEHFPLGNFYSSVFPPLQFALYTHPKRIYLVGIDLFGGHFDDATGKPEGKKDTPDTWHNSEGGLSPEMQQQWQSFKDFAALHYPDIEIISINPVGLKGMFKDEYTEAYLKEQGEASK